MYILAGTHPQRAPTVRAAHGWSQWWFWTVKISQILNFELFKFLKNQHYSASTQEIEYRADFWESLHLHFWRAQPPCRTCAEAVESRSSQNVVRRPMYVCTCVRAYVWMCVRVCSTAVESRASQNVVRHPIHEFVVSHMSHTLYWQLVLNRACRRMRLAAEYINALCHVWTCIVSRMNRTCHDPSQSAQSICSGSAIELVTEWLAALYMNALCHVWTAHAISRVNPHRLFAVVVQSSMSQNVVRGLLYECIVSYVWIGHVIPRVYIISAESICSGIAIELVTERGSLPSIWMHCVMYE